MTDFNLMRGENDALSPVTDHSFRLLAEHAPCVMWVADRHGAWVYVNPAWTRLTGQSAEAALGNGWMERVPEADRVRVKAAFMKGVANAESFEIEHDVWTADCGVRAINSCAQAAFRDGGLDGFVGSSSIAQRPSGYELSGAEQRKLFRNQRELETLVENSPDVIARLDRGLRHVYINRAASDAFGIDAASFIGKTASELGFPEPVAGTHDKAANEAFATGEERAFNFTIETSEGRTRHFTTRILPEFEHDGAIDSVLAVTYDVTQRTEAQQERDSLLVREQAARQQAEAAARARDQFLAIVSHELRSPLNGIQSWTHVLENRVDTATPSIARAIAGIKTGVQQQVRMIEELLDTTQVMTGKLRMTKEPFMLRPAIDAAVANASAAALEREVSISMDMPEAQLRLVGNAERVQQILWNLLTNAIKFSAPGSEVRVTVEVGDIDVCISVADDGKGIHPDFMPFLFDPFRQADSSNTRRTEGLGLGLTLVRRLTEMHGGRATAFSEGEDQGSTFSIYLPLRSEMEAEDDGPRAVRVIDQGAYHLGSLEGLRVLLVDDQKEARDSLSELLGQVGAVVKSTSSGQEAVNYLRHCDQDNAPQVIICDIAMPDQDGYATMQQVRQLERQVSTRFRGSIPAIALTAFAQREDRVRALANGFQVYLTKPANPTELVSIIASLTGSPSVTPQPEDRRHAVH